MTDPGSMESARKRELLDLAYDYVLRHGLSDLSLRPLAAAIDSSPRVLLFLFGSKEQLLRALLRRARADELQVLDRIAAQRPPADLTETGLQIWDWLSAPAHRDLLKVWLEAYARSVTEPTGPWAGFAQDTVSDWLTLLARTQPGSQRRTKSGLARRTRALAILRGGLIDLLATDETDRVTAAVRSDLAELRARE
ncbi:TetR family transcriptional regulator [Microlunatus elymi]|uniref:TetR family transcriptional regulator n=1 Tax=Microlunatus elymi TaxID=2596828 RepID=A0A516Q3G7_9ACTN|nr:TetR family transcriptional regulator [Microlunatus elymi]QDP97973.1 TetR family transcriptional regulator [Microlunatus elymi]